MTETSSVNGSPVATSPSTAHVPAWKKLGLKLKYAKDTSIAVNGNGDVSNDPSTPPPSKKRNLPNGNHSTPDETGSPHPSNKKRRIDAENEPPSAAKTPALLIPSSSLKKAHSESRRKSVSFTPDTKTRDGESSKDLLRNWEMQYAEELLAAQEERARQDVEAEADAETETSASDHLPKQKKEKKRKKEKPGTSPTPVAEKYEPPMLAYLNAYYTTRSEWKFRKNMETSLFKHLFSAEKIPPRYNAPLFCYLTGLKGDGAKQRLRTSAKEAIKADESEIESRTEGSMADSDTSGDPETAKANYEDAIVSFRNSLSDGNADYDGENQVRPDFKDAFEKRKRAELVLWALGGTATSETPTSRSETDAKSESTNGVKKKRKNRTAVVDISSSSESESLSSDSSDSEGEPSSSKQPPTQDALVKSKKALRTSPASSSPSPSSSASSSSAPSSSSSSSSSSESESDSPTPSASESESNDEDGSESENENENENKSSSSPSSASSPSSSSVSSSSSFPQGVPLNPVAV